MKLLVPFEKSTGMQKALSQYKEGRYPIALTGAGISVPSGIPDFRSPGGLWSVFKPEEYATLEVFLQNPDKAWELYRALGKVLMDKVPNQGHTALATLEKNNVLRAIITQNVDRLHQMAGSSNVIEIHGEHQHLHCLQCRNRIPVEKAHIEGQGRVDCKRCGFPLKPCVVLFGEDVRQYKEVSAIAAKADVLLVIGTSAGVYPAAELPHIVKQNGGVVYEFNQENAMHPSLVDYSIQGDAAVTLPWFVEEVLAA